MTDPEVPRAGRHPRVLIAGSYGHGNCGDEAILGAIVADLRRRDPDLELTVVAGDVGQVRRDHGVDAVSWTDWAAILDAVKSADLVLQGGGGLFFDYFPFEPAKLLTPAARELTHHASIAYAVRLLGKPFMLYACGVGPLRTEDSRHAVAGICEGADRITVRDEESAALLAAIGIPEKRIEVTADPAFRTPFGRPPDVEGLFGDGEGRRDRPLFVACPRPWPADAAGEGWLPKMAAALGTFVRACDGRLVLVPFHATVDDPVVDRMAAESGLGDDVRTLPSGLPYSQVAGWIRAADMVVGMRLHSIIFAAAAAVPAVAVAYDPKVRSLARALEIEDCAVDLDAIDALEGVLRRTWERRGDVAERLRRSSERLKSATDRNGDLAMALLASRAASAARSGVPASPVPPDEPQRKPSTSPRILFLLALPASDSLLAMLHARLEGLRDRGVAAMVCFLSTSTGESAAPEFELPAQVCGREGLAEVLRRFEPDVIDLIDAGDSLAEIERTRPGARVILEVRTSDPVGLAPLLDPALASRVEALIVPSRAQAETVAAVSAVPVPVLVVPDSLERESRDAPEADVEIPAEPVVGWSGSWDDPGSNWEDFVEIAAGVAGRSPAEFWFVAGAPSSALEQEVISKMVRFAGPEIRFRWFPRRGRRALRSFYATIARSGGCLVSVTSGMDVLEAMSQECAVVVPNAGQIRDLIETGVNGWTYPAGDVDAAGRFVELALANAPLRKTIVRAARQSALAFVPDRSVDALMDVVQSAHPPSGNPVRVADPASDLPVLRRLLSTAIERIGRLDDELASLRDDAGAAAKIRDQMERAVSAGNRYVRELVAERESTVRRLNEINHRSAERIAELSRSLHDAAAENAAPAGEPRASRSSRLRALADLYGKARRLVTRSGRTPRPDPAAGRGEEIHPRGRT